MAERLGRERATGARAAVSLLRRNRDFRRLFLASVISLGGDWFLFVALGGLVIEVTGEAFAVGVLIMAQELPVFLATPWAGWLADRFDPRRRAAEPLASLRAARRVVGVRRGLRPRVVGIDPERRGSEGPADRQRVERFAVGHDARLRRGPRRHRLDRLRA